MTGPRIGSLFTGYGGLDDAVLDVLGGRVVFVADIAPAACRILADRHPDVPNLGDVSTVDWATVPAVDVLTAGYPCQPFSTAGLRKGSTDERHLWPYVAAATAALRPTLLVLENVDGHRTMGFDVVLGDLADLGFDAEWSVVRASDVGAPHGRARVFIVAFPTDADMGRWAENVVEPGDVGPATGEVSEFVDGHRTDGPLTDAGRRQLARTRPAGNGLPVATECRHRSPTDADGPGREARRDTGHGGQCVRSQSVGPSLAPADAQSGRRGTRPGPSEATAGHGRPGIGDGSRTDWGQYAAAIDRWERVTGRPAPAPTVPGVNGRPRLSPYFVEWMMGLEPGHVTGHGLRPAAALATLGNGVVPQQAAHAIRGLLARAVDR